MPKERTAEYKPLSFSTTMRNPARIAKQYLLGRKTYD